MKMYKSPLYYVVEVQPPLLAPIKMENHSAEKKTINIFVKVNLVRDQNKTPATIECVILLS